MEGLRGKANKKNGTVKEVRGGGGEGAEKVNCFSISA